ncbi:GatB/YqeY domain-containing protein [Candidatus Peregrinibacteria bacterium]|nr:GatB/YqeY domain-containing protein [Candidatus Peregrinibacteria bacterium]
MLKEQIIADMIAAMKSKYPSLETLRMLKADIMKYEVSGKDMVATDDVVLDICKRSIKQRKEAAEGFIKGGKTELAEKEMSEIAYFEKYMPEQMSEDEVKKIASEVISQMNATQSDFGKVMGAVMGKCKGQADGNVVSKVVKELL